MVIRSLEREYLVIQKIDGREEPEQFLCRELKSDSQKEYVVGKLKIGKQVTDFIPFLAELLQENTFSGFEEYFTDEQYFYMAASAGRGETLIHKLDTENCSLAERIEIGKNLLEQILISDAPDYFICQALKPDRVRISRSLEISFRYGFDDFENYKNYSFRRTRVRLAGILNLLYDKELSLRAFPEMETLLGRLMRGEISDVMKVYQDFLDLYERWKNKKEETLEPDSFWFRVWRWLKGLAKAAVKLVSVAVIGAALVYLILSVKALWDLPPAAGHYEQIGTLIIK